MKKICMIIFVMICFIGVVDSFALENQNIKILPNFQNIVPINVWGYRNSIGFILQDGRWVWIEYEKMDKSLRDMRLNTVGDLYIVMENNKEVGYGWKEKGTYTPIENKNFEEIQTLKTLIQKQNDILQKLKTIKTELPTPEWNEAYRKTPPINHIVLVKMKDNIITTAYFTENKEWKLATNKNQILGGENIIVIEWREI